MGVEGAHPTEEEIQEIRQELANKLTEAGLVDDVDQADLDRINSDDKYVSKYFRHVFDHPGSQTEAAVKMMINTLKWRKEMGASSIREEDFPSGMFERGALFSRNRFGVTSLSTVIKSVCPGIKTVGSCWCSASSSMSRERRRWRT